MFSSATAQRCGTGTAEARDRINSFSSAISALSPPQFPFHTAAPSQRKTKKVFKIAHIIWPLMKETKNVSKSITYEGNDRILLSESNLRSGFPVGEVVRLHKGVCGNGEEGWSLLIGVIKTWDMSWQGQVASKYSGKHDI